jgi:hypothetical protein
MTMPNRIDEILFERHAVDRSTLASLSKDEVEELRRIALQRRDSVNRVRALGFLVRLSDPAADEAVRKILADSAESPDLRAAAAALAARFGKGAETWLVESLRYSAEAVVRLRIAASLGEIGSRHSADALRELAKDNDAGVRSQAEFSLSVLAAREGIEGFALPVPAKDQILEPRADDASAFTVRRASLRATAQVLESLGKRTFDMHLERDNLYAIACERAHMILGFDKQLMSTGVADWVASRPRLVGLACALAPVEDTYSVQWLIFSWPSQRGHVHLAAHRPSGQQILYGSATLEARALSFMLDSLRGPGRLAIRLRGLLVDGGLEVHEAVAARRRELGLVPRALELPGLGASHTLGPVEDRGRGGEEGN